MDYPGQQPFRMLIMGIRDEVICPAVTVIFNARNNRRA